MEYAERLSQAESYYAAAMQRVAATPPPEGQKYAPGTRVKIDEIMPFYMSHFPAGKLATVLYTYAHAYGGNDVKSYSVDIDGRGSCAWYDEAQLTAI